MVLGDGAVGDGQGTAVPDPAAIARGNVTGDGAPVIVMGPRLAKTPAPAPIAAARRHAGEPVATDGPLPLISIGPRGPHRFRHRPGSFLMRERRLGLRDHRGLCPMLLTKTWSAGLQERAPRPRKRRSRRAGRLL